MKVLYVGGADAFAQTLVNRFAKEDDEVYLVAKQNFEKWQKPSLHYKYYALNDSGPVAEKIFLAINPGVLVFGGDDLRLRTWDSPDDANRYIAQLNQWLCFCAQSGCRVVLLSSTEVYGAGNEAFDEASDIAPQTLKGRTCVIAEDLVRRHAQLGHFSYAIFRCDAIYEYHYIPGSGSLTGVLGDEVLGGSQLAVSPNVYLQPICVGDVVDAIKRVITKSGSVVLNLCGGEPVLLGDLYRAMAKRLNANCEISAGPPTAERSIVSQAAKNELEWSDHKQLLRQLEDEDLPRPKRSKRAANNTTPQVKEGKLRPIGRLVENLVLFGVFLGLAILGRDNVMFSAVNWMMLYVIVVSLFYGTMNSFISIILASVVYFASQDMQVTELTNFYSYVGGIIKIIEYICAGIMISYSTDMLREDLRSKEADRRLLIDERKQLEIINDENVRIKNEYEKRLLSAKTSLPKLYSIISRINVLQPDKIFSEVLNVVSDIMETDTVSVYVMRENSAYLRLITSRNERSAFSGKSWNLNDYPEIYKSIQRDELFVGNCLEREPAFVAPIYSNNRCIAVVVLMEMPFSGQSLYHTNLLRTLSVLVSEAVSKALEYEQRVRRTRYIDGTEVLRTEEFASMVALSKEKKAQGVADYCIVECDPPEDAPTLELFYQRLMGLSRDTDILGDAGNNHLHILLPNNTENEAAFVIKRLEDNNLTARIL